MEIKLKIDQRIILLTVGIFVVLVCIISFVIFPTVRYISSITADISRTSSELEEQYQKIRLLKKSIAELDIIREQTAVFSSAIISKEKELDVIRDFERISKEHHVNQQLSVEFLTQGKDVPRDQYVFTFSTSGSLDDLIRYLGSLEKLPYYLIIENISFNKPQKQTVDGSHLLLLNFQARIYSN